MEARHKFVRHRFPIRKRVFLFKRRKNKASLRKQLPYFLRPSALLSKILITSPLRPSPSSKDIGKVGFTTFSDVRQSKFSYREGRGAHTVSTDRSQSRAARCDAATAAEGLLRVCRKFSITRRRRRRRRRRAGLLRARGRTLGAARNTVGNTWLRSTWVCSPSLAVVYGVGGNTIR